MKQFFLLSTILSFFAIQIAVAQPGKDCCTPSEIPLAAAYFFPPLNISNTAGSGFTDNVGCSCLPGEGGSTWFAFSAVHSGTFEMLIQPKTPPGSNFNFSIWEQFCPCQPPVPNPFPTTVPVVCNADAAVGPTGVATDPLATFGVPASASFSQTVQLKGGTNYFLLVSNAANDGAGFDISIGGTAQIGAYIEPVPDNELIGPDEVCAGGSGVFTVTPPIFGTSNYAWVIKQFGVQVNITQNGQSPTKSLVFPNPGTYEVCVTADSPLFGCLGSAEICKTVEVTQLPIPAGYESGYVCTGDYYVAGNGEVFYFGGTFNLHYQTWQGCDSVVQLTLQQKISDFIVTAKEVCKGDCVTWGGETYCESGIYDEVLQNQWGCDSTNELILIAVPVETKINGADTLDCITTSITLNSNGSIFAANPVYVWKKGNTVVGSSPTLTVTTGGTYTLTISSKVDNGNRTCSETAEVVIVQNTTPPQGVTATGGNVNCYTSQVTLQGNSTTAGVTYHWTGPNGFSSNLQNPTVSAQGNYTLTVTGTNGCTKTATAVVSENKVPPTANASANGNLNCNASSVLLSGGGSSTGSQYSFLWTTTNGHISANETTLTPTVDEAGTYVLTVTNTTNGCTATASVQVTLAPPVSAQITDSDDVACNGGSNGAATVSASGGNGTYSYQWSNGQSGATATGLTAGSYSVTITDVDGCSATQSVTIGQPQTLLANAATTPQTEFGVNDGTATANPTGGSGPYTYSWNNGGATQTITGLAPDNYTVTVTDANGCSVTQTVTVAAVDCVVKASTEQTDVTCNGAADGTATISLESATAPITFSWSNGENSQTASNLSGGNYEVTATDANGCEVVATVTIVEPAAIATNATSTDLTAFNANNGTATASPNGGTPPYTFSWSNGSDTQSITDLAPGSYTVIVTDANDCSASQTVVVEQFGCSSSATTIVSNVSCNGGADGQATLSPVGGTAPFNYEWSNGENSSTITNLTTGSYSGTVTDANGCPATAVATITEPDAVGYEVTNEVQAMCGESDGSLTITGTGGTPGYTYLWQTGEASETLDSIAAGTYTFTVTDNNGCNSDFEIVLGNDDNEPPMLILQDIAVSIGPDGTVTITPQMLDNGSFDNCAITSWTLSQETFGCDAGGANTVTVTASDANGNTSSATAIVTVSGGSAGPDIDCPDNIALSACDPVAEFDVTAVENCGGGDVTLTQDTGLPSGSNFPVGTTTITFTATNASGGQNSCSFEVNVAPAMVVSTTAQDVTCFGESDGSAVASVTGGGAAPYTYAWSNGANTPSASGLIAGTYTVTVTDAGGCTSTATSTVEQPTDLTTALVNIVNATNGETNGSIEVTVSGGVLPYTFLWKNSAGMAVGSTEDISGLGAGTYTLVATDANGCISQSGYTIQNAGPGASNEVGQGGHVVIYPNPTSGEVTLEIEGATTPERMEVSAFDVTGRPLLRKEATATKLVIDLTGKPAGVYLLKVVIGQHVESIRLVLTK